MKIKLLTIVLSLLLLSFGISSAQEGFTLDHVDGLFHPGSDTIVADGVNAVTFFIRITNDATPNGGVTNGFRVYSDNGAEWASTTPDTVYPGWTDLWDLISAIIPINVDGVGADTVGFGSSRLLAGNLPALFDEVVYSLTIGPIDPAFHDLEICLDSSFYPVTGIWLWGSPSVTPSWDGPHCFTTWDEATDVTPGNGALPTTFGLAQNYPNPFNPTTAIQYDVPKRSDVTLSIYNVLGQKIKTLVNESQAANSYKVDWDGTSDAGTQVSSGIYFYRLEASDFVSTKKMMMLK